MTTDDNKAVVRRFNEGVKLFFQTGELGMLDELCAPDFVHHGPGIPPDLEGFKQMVPIFRSAFSDVDVEVGDLIAEGDRVVDRVTVRGTHTGDFMGIPPSGKRWEMQEIHIARIVDGKIAERWTMFDMSGLMQQLGGMPG